MTEHFLYLTTIGRTTGAERRIEIWFVEHEGAHFIVAERRELAGWVKNLRKQPRAAFSVGTREAPESVRPRAAASARFLENEDDPRVKAVKALMDAKYGWSDGLLVKLSPLPRRPA